MLYEGGFRVGEVATLKWGDIKIDPSGVVVNVRYKTTKIRYIRLVMSKEPLAKWKSDYPGEYPNSGQLCATRLRMIISEIAGRRPDAIFGGDAGVFESLECIGVASA